MAVVHLSDIHIRKKSNPVLAKIDQIASAINSTNPTVSLFVFVISGDIANSGEPEEYAAADEFFGGIRKKMKELRPDADVRCVCVPGNHDCILPESEKNVREILIDGLLPSMRETAQDKALLDQVLRVQRSYNDFQRSLMPADGSWDGICQTVLLEHRGKKIQINLYNTAMLLVAMRSRGSFTSRLRYFVPELA
jgi:predicted MPP superfamily phosphohydrolase